MLGEKLPLAPLREGELDVWVTVCVRLTEPLHNVDTPTDPPVAGYFRNFGIRILGPQPKRYLEQLISDGHIDWNETEFREIDPASLERDIRKGIAAPDANGIWYSSGRMYFPAEGAG